MADSKPPIDFRFAIFRNADAREEDGVPMMRSEPMTETEMQGGMKLMEAGANEGHVTRLLFSTGKFTLVHAWFKSGFPLPRHSHDTDCLYYVVAGSLQMGTSEVKAGDGFFVGANVPYTYTPGPDGVEVLEFRADGDFNIKLLANNPAFWERSLATVVAKQAEWPTETPPTR